MSSFAKRLLAWYDVHGRHDFPWQRDRTPYSAWVAEIMLQQTQAATVVPFYERFLRRFPSVHALAEAPQDDVLKHWSGLGYYARARNLWRAARVIVAERGGEVPKDFEALHALPGIGRSTAGAILAQAHDDRWPILDGNVKRVLARHHAVAGWPGEPRVANVLWEHAEAHTPLERVADYTQAIMDLGATVCTRSRPACTLCPVVDTCLAAASGTQAQFPAPRPKRARAQRRVDVLVVQDPDGRVLLERRPAQGIWGGLYSLPELPIDSVASEWCERAIGASVAAERELTVIAHAFTHFDLDLAPRLLRLQSAPSTVMDRSDWLWYKPGTELAVGVPAPVAALLKDAAQLGDPLD